MGNSFQLPAPEYQHKACIDRVCKKLEYEVFLAKTGPFGDEKGAKTGFAVTNQLTGIKSQPIDSLGVKND
jgi:hypothetical protein